MMHISTDITKWREALYDRIYRQWYLRNDC